MASPYCPYGCLSMTLIVMMIFLPIQTGSIETGWFSLRQTGISQKASPSCPYGFSLNDLIVREKWKRLIPNGDIETQSIAQRQHSNLSCCLTPWSGGVRWSSASAAQLFCGGFNCPSRRDDICFIPGRSSVFNKCSFGRNVFEKPISCVNC